MDGGRDVLSEGGKEYNSWLQLSFSNRILPLPCAVQNSFFHAPPHPLSSLRGRQARPVWRNPGKCLRCARQTSILQVFIKHIKVSLSPLPSGASSRTSCGILSTPIVMSCTVPGICASEGRDRGTYGSVLQLNLGLCMKELSNHMTKRSWILQRIWTACPYFTCLPFFPHSSRVTLEAPF